VQHRRGQKGLWGCNFASAKLLLWVTWPPGSLPNVCGGAGQNGLCAGSGISVGGMPRAARPRAAGWAPAEPSHCEQSGGSFLCAQMLRAAANGFCRTGSLPFPDPADVRQRPASNHPRGGESSQTVPPKGDHSAWPCPLSNAHLGVSRQAPAALCVAREREKGKDASGTGWAFFRHPSPTSLLSASGTLLKWSRYNWLPRGFSSPGAEVPGFGSWGKAVAPSLYFQPLF